MTRSRDPRRTAANRGPVATQRESSRVVPIRAQAFAAPGTGRAESLPSLRAEADSRHSVNTSLIMLCSGSREGCTLLRLKTNRVGPAKTHANLYLDSGRRARESACRV